MVSLSREIVRVLVEEYGPGEVLREAVDRAKVADRERLNALRRLARHVGEKP